MSQLVINVGTVANDGTGDPLRTAFQDCNANFTELYGLSSGSDAAEKLMRASSNFPEETYYVCAGSPVSVGVTGTPAINRYNYIPFVLGQTVVVDKICFVLLGGGAGGAKARCGLYNANQTTLKPTTLIVDGGELATTVGQEGVKSSVVSLTLTKNVVYCSAYVSGTATSTINTVSANGHIHPHLGFANLGGGLLTTRVGWKVDLAYAAFAADISGSTFVTSEPGEAPGLVYFRPLSVS